MTEFSFLQVILTVHRKNSSCLLCFDIHDSRYHGQIGASLILGGVDCTGNHLYTVGPYGSVDKIPYIAMGMQQINISLLILIFSSTIHSMSSSLCHHNLLCVQDLGVLLLSGS